MKKKIVIISSIVAGAIAVCICIGSAVSGHNKQPDTGTIVETTGSVSDQTSAETNESTGTSSKRQSQVHLLQQVILLHQEIILLLQVKLIILQPDKTTAAQTQTPTIQQTPPKHLPVRLSQQIILRHPH